jgi:hypothetical protein
VPQLRTQQLVVDVGDQRVHDIGANQGSGPPRAALRRTDGELILLWALPAAAIIWFAAFLRVAL